MGVYTYADKTLGLKLSPRLDRILKETQTGKQPSEKDIEFLIDESARFETMAVRVREGKFKVEDSILDDVYDLKGVMQDLMTELENIHAHKIGMDGTYLYELSQFNPHTEYNIEKASPSMVESEVREAIRMVKDLQKSFDGNEDELEVKAFFKYLKGKYGVDLIVTSKSKVEDIVSEIIGKVLEVIEKEAKDKEDTIARLKRLT